VIPLRTRFQSVNPVARWSICAIALLAIPNASPGTRDDRRTDILSAPKTPLLLSPGEESKSAAAGAVAPPSRRRFDLVCDMHWRVLAPFTDDELRMISPIPTNEPWRSISRELVDLGKMYSCDPVACADGRFGRIANVNSERITFYDDGPGLVWWVRWRDGRTYLRVVTGHRVNEARGSCRQEPFSGFPDIDESQVVHD
jgi:hypothetical protein